MVVGEWWGGGGVDSAMLEGDQKKNFTFQNIDINYLFNSKIFGGVSSPPPPPFFFFFFGFKANADKRALASSSSS